MRKRYLYWWISVVIGYIFPFVYFFIKLGITKSAVSIVLPVVILGIALLLKLCNALPKWVGTWKPSVIKGLVKALPTFILFIVLITLGLVIKHMIDTQADAAFSAYFEVVIVVFGSLCVSGVFGALHQKHKEIELLKQGYVLGVVNNGH